MYCKKCGRKLEEGLEICPFCGADIKTGRVYGEKKVKETKVKKNKGYIVNSKPSSPLYSILGFVFSICGLSLLPLLGSILGLVFSGIGLHETKKTNAKCSGLGVAGLIISLISLILYIAVITVFILMTIGIIDKIPGMPEIN